MKQVIQSACKDFKKQNAYQCLLVAGAIVLLISVMLPAKSWSARIVKRLHPENEASQYNWDTTLQRFFTLDGQLNLKAMKLHPEMLNGAMDELKKGSPLSDPDDYKTPDERMTYWLNAYNTLALRLILDAYPETDMGKVSHFYTQDQYLIGNTPTSLRDIEHELATQYAFFPAVVAGLNDFTMGSAPFYRTAFTSESVREDVTQLLTQWIQTDGAMVIQRPETQADCPRIWLNPRFKPFATAFIEFARLQDDKIEPTLLDALQPYVREDARQYLMTTPTCPIQVEWLDISYRLR